MLDAMWPTLMADPVASGEDRLGAAPVTAECVRLAVAGPTALADDRSA
jgi:hypothetical protein